MPGRLQCPKICTEFLVTDLLPCGPHPMFTFVPGPMFHLFHFFTFSPAVHKAFFIFQRVLVYFNYD